MVREGKGEKGRLTMLSASPVEPLKAQITFGQKQHARDLEDGYGSVELPFVLPNNLFDEVLDWAHTQVRPNKHALMGAP